MRSWESVLRPRDSARARIPRVSCTSRRDRHKSQALRKNEARQRRLRDRSGMALTIPSPRPDTLGNWSMRSWESVQRPRDFAHARILMITWTSKRNHPSRVVLRKTEARQRLERKGVAEPLTQSSPSSDTLGNRSMRPWESVQRLRDHAQARTPMISWTWKRHRFSATSSRNRKRCAVCDAVCREAEAGAFLAVARGQDGH